MSADEQIAHLTAVAVERGWTVASVFTDRPTTVKKDRRPGEVALLDAIRSGVVDKVLIVGIDRVGRSLADLVSFMEACRTAAVSLWLDAQA
jgi:DNA invertase Pin-like site-specific DNA recombinase